VVTERLNELFECPSPAFRALFPRGMPVKACLRRQAELRILRDGKGRRTGAEAVHPVCALECERGRANLARAAVPLSACGTCGSAQVGNSTCPTCAEERAAHVVQPREAPRPPPQGLIWTDQAPDAPIAPPRPRALAFGDDVLEDLTRRVAEAARRSGPPPTETAEPHREEQAMRAVADAETAKLRNFEISKPTPIAAPVNPEQPANEPAEERTMPRGKRESPCEGCGATGMRHRKSCKEKLAPKPAAKATPRAPRPRYEAEAELGAKSVPELVHERAGHLRAVAEIEGELQRRREQINQALGESKAA
jgi:ribosomal protein L32